MKPVIQLRLTRNDLWYYDQETGYRMACAGGLLRIFGHLLPDELPDKILIIGYLPQANEPWSENAVPINVVPLQSIEESKHFGVELRFMSGSFLVGPIHLHRSVYHQLEQQNLLTIHPITLLTTLLPD